MKNDEQQLRYMMQKAELCLQGRLSCCFETNLLPFFAAQAMGGGEKKLIFLCYITLLLWGRGGCWFLFIEARREGCAGL
jgi:hypothetical protein